MCPAARLQESSHCLVGAGSFLSGLTATPPGAATQVDRQFAAQFDDSLENKAVHAVFPGGCAVLAATQVEEIERAEWQDLGMPETLRVNRVREFGPLIISIDTKGNNLFEQNRARFNERKGAVIEKIDSQVRFIQ